LEYSSYQRSRFVLSAWRVTGVAGGAILSFQIGRNGYPAY